jgi:hypothetical protein
MTHNHKDYLNWLHGVSQHEKRNICQPTTDTNSQNNSKEPVCLDESFFRKIGKSRVVNKMRSGGRATGRAANWMGGKVEKATKGLDPVRRAVNRVGGKVEKAAKKIETSRFGTEYGAVAAGARARSRKFYGHGHGVDTGFGKPVGHDDKEILKRRDRMRQAADVAHARNKAYSKQPKRLPGSNEPKRLPGSNEPPVSKQPRLPASSPPSPPSPSGQAKRLPASSPPSPSGQAKRLPASSPPSPSGQAKRVPGSNRTGQAKGSTPSKGQSAEDVRIKMKNAWNRAGGRKGMTNKHGEARTAEFMKAYQALRRKK